MMKQLDIDQISDSLILWAKNNCDCGNMKVDGDFWRGSAPDGWSACEYCNSVHYGNQSFFALELVNKLISAGYL